MYENTTIKEEKDKIETLKKILTDKFWEEYSLPKLERIHLDIRDLMKLLKDDNSAQTFAVNI